MSKRVVSSQGVSVQGVSVREGLHLGLCPGSMSRGSLSRGFSVQGSLWGKVSVRGSLSRVSLSKGSLSRGSLLERPPDRDPLPSVNRMTETHQKKHIGPVYITWAHETVTWPTAKSFEETH